VARSEDRRSGLAPDQVSFPLTQLQEHSTKILIPSSPSRSVITSQTKKLLAEWDIAVGNDDWPETTCTFACQASASAPDQASFPPATLHVSVLVQRCSRFSVMSLYSILEQLET
jgi:hypothetical protein